MHNPLHPGLIGLRLAWRGLILAVLAVGIAACQPVETTPLATLPGPATPAPASPPTETAIPTSPTIPIHAITPTSPAPTLQATRMPVSPTPDQPACLLAGGSFETGQLEVELLPAPLEFRVYLPPCYAQQPAQRYPVLYLIHGQSYTDDQWQRLGAGAAADALLQAGELPPFLMVMPRDRAWQEPDVDQFGMAVTQALLPWVDEHYRTLPSRQYRGVGGLSRGGAWALHLGLAEWELFGAVGMHSGFAFHSDVPFIRLWLSDIPAESMPRFYLDLGDNDRPEISESVLWFENLLTEQGIAHEWHLFSGYHEEAYWSTHLEQYLRWYASEW